MGLPKYGTKEWQLYKYKRMKAENIGKNFQYWNESHDALLENGWQMFEFVRGGYKNVVTTSMIWAKEVVT